MCVRSCRRQLLLTAMMIVQWPFLWSVDGMVLFLKSGEPEVVDLI
jgi:hypothetical protein